VILGTDTVFCLCQYFLDKPKQRIFITKEYFSESLPQTVQSRLADTQTCLVNLVVIWHHCHEDGSQQGVMAKTVCFSTN
jgi:hypothetical protein